jgi:MFS transporter, SP family, solute carrier family 2 (facilitated glucose transporter), member 1
MLGGFSGGWMANRFGRKGGLLLNNVLGISGACLMGSTKIVNSYEMLFLGRFIIGVNCGKVSREFIAVCSLFLIYILIPLCQT